MELLSDFILLLQSPLIVGFLLFIKLTILSSISLHNLIISLLDFVNCWLLCLKHSCDTVNIFWEFSQNCKKFLYLLEIKFWKTFSLTFNLAVSDIFISFFSLQALFAWPIFNLHRTIFILLLSLILWRWNLWLFVEEIFIHNFKICVKFS